MHRRTVPKYDPTKLSCSWCYKILDDDDRIRSHTIQRTPPPPPTTTAQVITSPPPPPTTTTATNNNTTTISNDSNSTTTTATATDDDEYYYCCSKCQHRYYCCYQCQEKDWIVGHHSFWCCKSGEKNYDYVIQLCCPPPNTATATATTSTTTTSFSRRNTPSPDDNTTTPTTTTTTATTTTPCSDIITSTATATATNNTTNNNKKGYGMFAKRTFFRGEKILVERPILCRTSTNSNHKNHNKNRKNNSKNIDADDNNNNNNHNNNNNNYNNGVNELLRKQKTNRAATEAVVNSIDDDENNNDKEVDNNNTNNNNNDDDDDEEKLFFSNSTVHITDGIYDNPFVRNAVMSLEPNDGSLIDKYIINHAGLYDIIIPATNNPAANNDSNNDNNNHNNYPNTNDDDNDEQEETGVFINFSRINHDCIGNCTHDYNKQHNLMVLVANDTIIEGTEITFSYKSYGIANYTERYFACTILRGFTCTCMACQNPTTIGYQLDLMIQYNTIIQSFGITHTNVNQASYAGYQLLQLYDLFHFSDLLYCTTYGDLFSIYITKKDTYESAIQYIQKAYEHALVFYGYPEHEEVQQLYQFMCHPQLHPGYCILDD